ncbi:unnamed protein product [Echinostoma caproni]|uniref:Intraflagellar transport protein 46 homolog n=1 Tax=Echinostoma caproni TaxID=27848 RepID=A0A183BFX4_9TREM|nr:unnamed protein product [Echinostoma caproni]
MDEIEVAELAEDFEVDEGDKEPETENSPSEPYLKYQHMEHEMDSIVSNDYITFCATHGKVSSIPFR